MSMSPATQATGKTGTRPTTIANSAVLVTGANRGIGQALVEEALARGARRVYASARQPLAHPDSRVTPLLFDLTDAAQIQAAAARVESLDVLVNNAGLAFYDDLSDPAAIERHLAVNLFGGYAVTRAFLPPLTRSRGAIVNVLSAGALAAIPLIPAYSISKAAAFSLSQSLRALLAGQGVRVHAVMTGPTDTDMSRGLDIPKASPQAVARAIFDGVERGDEEIFPDPLSAALAPGWNDGAVKAMERQNAGLVPAGPASFTTAFTVDRTPAEVFAAINDVRGWWSGEIEGRTDQVGAQFTYRYQDVHRSRQAITELVPGRRVAWHVLDGYLSFTADPAGWTGTDITFDITATEAGTEVRFTHVGLVPEDECFDSCSSAWGFYIGTSLRNLITEGAGQPNERVTSGGS